MLAQYGVQLATLGGLVASLTALGAWERRRLDTHLASIRWRIHINGTRGKSSTTRLVAAGLRASGRTTIAKTTGSLPRLLLANGAERDVVRHGSANIIEQRDVARAAAMRGAEALVLECMALRPNLQWLAEEKLIKATHAIITNVRPDHLEVMGPDALSVARALAGMVPRKGVLVTGERNHLDVLAYACRDRGSQLLYVGEAPMALPEGVRISEVPAPTAEEMANFSYFEHSENVHVSLALLAELGVARDVALAGMWKAQPDVGALASFVLDYFGRKMCFVNALAANDPVSTGLIWNDMLARHTGYETRICLVNCRNDRPERSVQLAQAMARWPQPHRLVLLGRGTHVFARAAYKAGVVPEQLLDLGDAPPYAAFEALVGLIEHSGLIVGMGNIGGVGLPLVRLFRNRSAPKPRRAA